MFYNTDMVTSVPATWEELVTQALAAGGAFLPVAFLPARGCGWLQQGTKCGILKKTEKGVIGMKLLVSACLLGENCKYNGGNNLCPKVVRLAEGREVILVCPELEAGFGCPRTPMEIVDGVLTDRDGKVLDEPMGKAIDRLLERIRQEEIECAILKSRSPTCGVRQVYDGTFSGTLVEGMGLFAKALQEAGYRVIDSEEV